MRLALRVRDVGGPHIMMWIPAHFQEVYGMDYYGNDGYLFQSPHIGEGVTIVLTIYLFVITFLVIYGVASYVIKSLGLYQFAKRQHMEYPWLAFVPFARTYLHGELSGDIPLKKRHICKPGIWMLVLPILQGVVFLLFYIITLIFVGWTAYSATMRMHSYMTRPSIFMTFGAGDIIGTIAIIVLFIVSVLAVSAFTQVLKVLVNHQILKQVTTSNMSVVHAVLMSIVPLYEPICLLVMSRRPILPGVGPEEMEQKSVETGEMEPVEQMEQMEQVEQADQMAQSGKAQDEMPNEAKNVFVPQRGLMSEEHRE